jgi:hypothetical protein
MKTQAAGKPRKENMNNPQTPTAPPLAGLTGSGVVDGRPVKLMRHITGEWAEVWYLDTDTIGSIAWNKYLPNGRNTNQ